MTDKSKLLFDKIIQINEMLAENFDLKPRFLTALIEILDRAEYELLEPDSRDLKFAESAIIVAQNFLK
jgi:hypothetical protein